MVAKAHQGIALQLLQLIPDAVQAIEAAMDARLPPWFGLQLVCSFPVAGVDNYQHDRCVGGAELFLGDWRLDQRLVTVEVLAERAPCAKSPPAMACQMLEGAELMLFQFTSGGGPQTIEVGGEMHRWQIGIKAGPAQQNVGQSTTAQQLLASPQVGVCLVQGCWIDPAGSWLPGAGTAEQISRQQAGIKDVLGKIVLR